MAVSDVPSIPSVQAGETDGDIPSAAPQSISGESSSKDKFTPCPMEKSHGEVNGKEADKGSSSSSAINVRQLKGRKHKKKIMIKTLEKKLKVLESHIKK